MRIILITCCLAFHAALAELPSESWKAINPKLDSLVDLEEERDNLPRRKWFGRDQRSNKADFEKLLNEAVIVLADSSAARVREDIEALRNSNRNLRREIADHRRNQLSAPEEAFFTTSKSGYEARIERALGQIEANENQIANLKIDFAAAMESYGLKMDPGQIDLLLNSVLGDDIVSSVAVYENVKLISIRLAELTQQSREDLDISRRYYGMHVVLLKILQSMQGEFIRKVDQVYLPRINRIENEVESLQRESRRMFSRAENDSHRAHLKANLDSQALTLRTAALYRTHLRDQRDKMERAMRQTARDVEVASNTLRTVTASGELVSMIRSTQNSFDALASIQVPDLLVFENIQMQEEFASLTQRLNL